MNTFSPGDLVRAKSGGPVMMVEAHRGDDRYTFTWVAENGEAQSIVLPASLVVSVDPEAHLDQRGSAEKLPRDLRILDSQKVKLYEAMSAEGFNPASFEWSVVRSDYIPDGKISKVKGPEGTAYFFRFDRDENGKFVGIYSPGLEQLVSIQTGDEYHLFQFIGQWLSALSRELRHPDPWAMLGKGVLEQASTTETDNTSFTSEEIRRISENVEQIKGFLFENENLKPGHRAFVTNQLNVLVDSSKRLGRKEWLALALGVLIQTVVGLALPQDAAQNVGNQLITFSDGVFSWISKRPLFFPPQ